MDQRAEPGRTLADPQPRSLSVLDQAALWGNLGVSLLGPVTAVLVVTNGMSWLAALAAIAVGTVVGTLGLGLANVAGARSRVPAMVLLRGLFGGRLSYLPTVLNLIQLLGWATFELVVISTAAAQLLPWHTSWPYVVVAGLASTIMAVWPLGSVRLLRRIALVAVLAAMVYLTVQLLRAPLPPLAHGTFVGFWAGVDLVVAVSVSWIPLAADYSRHSRTVRGAFTGSFVGYTLTQVLCYGMGLLAFATVAGRDPSEHGMFAALIALPGGVIAFGVLVVRELDESFANVYSTGVSTQNLLPGADRRVLAVGIGVAATVLALMFDIAAYQNFLYLIGSVFVPMFAVFVARYFVHGGWRNWDSTAAAPARPMLLVPWLLGFAAYQLVNPGQIGWWVQAWTRVDGWLRFHPPSWLSASLFSFVVALVLSLPLRPRRVAPSTAMTPTASPAPNPAPAQVSTSAPAATVTEEA
jgi:putative hydroxymethylpyrimidine transporter CytX